MRGMSVFDGKFGGFDEWYGGNVGLWILRECKFSRFLVSSSSRPGFTPGLSFLAIILR